MPPSALPRPGPASRRTAAPGGDSGSACPDAGQPDRRALCLLMQRFRIGDPAGSWVAFRADCAGTNCPVRRHASPKDAAALIIAMEERMNGFCHARRYAVHCFQIGKSGTADGLGAAKMLEQPAFPRRTDTRDFVQRRGADRFLPPLPMRANGKAMRLVPEALHERERGRACRQRKGPPPGRMKLLTPEIALDPLGDTDQREFEAKFLQNRI